MCVQDAARDTFFKTILYQSMKRSDEMVDRLNRCLQVVPTQLQLARLLISDFFLKKDLSACHRIAKEKKKKGLGEGDLLGSTMMHASINN